MARRRIRKTHKRRKMAKRALQVGIPLVATALAAGAAAHHYRKRRGAIQAVSATGTPPVNSTTPANIMVVPRKRRSRRDRELMVRQPVKSRVRMPRRKRK